MMKGKLKQLVSILLISVLVLSMAAPGFAANYTSGNENGNTNTLTITSPTSGHSFELYQIFGGDRKLDYKGIELLTNIIWGDGIDYEGKVEYKDTETKLDLGYLTLIEALQKDSGMSSKFSKITTTTSYEVQAVEVAAALSEIATNSDAAGATAFANVADQFLIESKAISQDSGSETKTTDGKYTYTFSNLYDGYYLLKDQNGSLNGAVDQNGNTPTYTLYILSIVGGTEVKVEAKADTITIDKNIVDPDTLGTAKEELEKTEEYNIGDTITYELNKSVVPDMTGYDRFWYMIKDTLSAGLDFVKIESVYVGTKEVTEGTGDNTYTLIKVGDDTANTEYEIYIVFNNFKESYSSMVGEEIVVRYTVKLNEYANIGAVGNDNTVQLYYSNDPYENYNGEPSETTDKGLGQTTEKKTIAYTTNLKIKKVDAQTKEPLKGAKFKLTTKDGSKTYYTLETYAEYVYTADKNGTYVKVSSDPDVFELYDSTNPEHVNKDFYSRELSTEETNYYVTTEDSGKGEVEAETGSSGYVTFTGLGEGTYLLTETSAPDGYTLLADPIEITINFTDPTLQDDQPYIDKDYGTWTYSYTVGNNTYKGTIDAADEEVVITVTNTSGAYLPSTGGVGTIVFTVVGLCAMAGAVLFLYNRKRREEM